MADERDEHKSHGAGTSKDFSEKAVERYVDELLKRQAITTELLEDNAKFLQSFYKTADSELSSILSSGAKMSKENAAIRKLTDDYIDNFRKEMDQVLKGLTGGK